MSATYDELLACVRPHRQEHLLSFWHLLTDAERAHLAAQIQSLDFSVLEQLAAPSSSQADRAESPPAVRCNATDNRFSPEEARARGEAALRAGEVGMILVAGGQGTRLGFDHPKGMFAIGPVSGRSLFEIIIDRMQAVAARYQTRIPLLVMTSPATTAETEAYFIERHHFGLQRDEDLRFFEQGTLPAIDAETRRVLLADRHDIALAPDGHGGMLAALARVITFDALRKQGIKTLFYGQIDNPLLTVCDPEFLGYHLLAQSELTTQVVRKHDPAERVGVVAAVDGSLQIIEYSDLSPEQAARREADGSLTLWAGNTAVHAFAVSFLERVSQQKAALPLHFARKKVPYVDEAGVKIEPTEPNAIKFERFIFDLLPQARDALVVEVERAAAFAPVKNAPGAASDTPASAQAAMVALHRSWLEAAGAEVASDIKVEIHPALALDAEALRQRVARGTKFNTDTFLQ